MSDADNIADLVVKKLRADRLIDTETHRKHHEYIDVLISESRRRSARREQWIRAIGGYAAIAAIGAFFFALWEFAKSELRK